MFDFIKILDNIKKYNYEQLHISTLTLALKNSSSQPVLDFFEQFYDVAVKAFEKKIFIEAVFILTYCYNNGYKQDEIYKFIIDNYYLPFVNKYEKTYNDNINALKNYEFIYDNEYPAFSDLDVIFLPMELDLSKIHDGCLKYSKKENKFEIVESLVIEIKKADEIKNDLEGQRVFLYNVYDTDFIKWMHKKTHLDMAFALRTPNYLYYNSRCSFMDYLQIVDFTECLKIKKAVFIFGESELESILLKPETVTSNLVFCNNNFHSQAISFYATVTSINQKKNLIYDENINKLNNYYSLLTPAAIHEKIINKSARVALMVSKCTTALRYHIRDCHEALKKMGFTSKIFTEKSDISATSGSNKHEMADFLLNFKPDIILIINHFRWEWQTIPKEIAFVCWVQDLVPQLFDPESARKIGERDFVLSLFLKHSLFQKAGYPKNSLIYGILPANPYIYKKYALTEKETFDYSTDICVISNSGNAAEAMETSIFSHYKSITDTTLVNNVNRIYHEIYKLVFDSIYYEKKYYYMNDIQKLFQEYFINRNQLVSSAKDVYKLSFEFWVHVGIALYKDIPILWLHEKGYKMKLWGRTWTTHPVLKKYSMGVAGNGETMSKILNASKISLGLNPTITLHPRVMESLFSECFYIGNDVPAGEDLCNIREFLKLGTEVVLFKNKNDLYKKIDYYLSNDRERTSVVAAGRKKALDTLTYEVLMKNVLDRISERFSKAEI